MSKITYINGDATQPVGEGHKFIVHCCNDIGGWGSGFVLALNKRWDEPEARYREWFKEEVQADPPVPENCRSFKLGAAQVVKVEEDYLGGNLFVCNMIGQHETIKTFDTTAKDYVPPIRYKAIETALQSVATTILQMKRLHPDVESTMHGPKFGSDLAGGDWNKIEDIIKATVCSVGIGVTIYNWVG